jgi:hypothetical protein
MRISSKGKIEAAAAVASVGAGIAGAIMMEPIILAGAAVAAAVATGLQFQESRKRYEEALREADGKPSYALRR